jgi:hypothetical protein
MGWDGAEQNIIMAGSQGNRDLRVNLYSLEDLRIFADTALVFPNNLTQFNVIFW